MTPSEKKHKFYKTFERMSGLKTNKHKDFILNVVKHCCPEYFFHAPASTSGKRHQGQSIIAHTWSVCDAALKLAPVFRLEDMGDAISATCMLHDMIKFGKNYDLECVLVTPASQMLPALWNYPKPLEDGITGTHGQQLADDIIDLYKGQLSVEQVEIVSGIRYHMGRWTKREVNAISDNMIVPDEYGWERNNFTRLIHIADCTTAYGARYEH